LHNGGRGLDWRKYLRGLDTGRRPQTVCPPTSALP
jgi:hypothetical protein